MTLYDYYFGVSICRAQSNTSGNAWCRLFNIYPLAQYFIARKMWTIAHESSWEKKSVSFQCATWFFFTATIVKLKHMWSHL